MKKIIMMVAAFGLLTACGNNKAAQQDSATETEEAVEVVELAEAPELTQEAEEPAQDEPAVEEDEDDGTYKPPFRVTVVREYQDGGWINKDTYVFNVLKNGRLSGSTKYEHEDARFHTDHEVLGEDEFSGKWSTSSITMGDGRLTVYALDPSDRESTIYLPATCDYIWMCDYAWLECENWNTKKAMKVTKVEKL